MGEDDTTADVSSKFQDLESKWRNGKCNREEHAKT